MPGAMTPPRYSADSETASKVVAVPKSTTMHGPPWRRWAATALTMRSAPSSRGLSIASDMPVRTPGPMTRASRRRYLSASDR